MTDALKTLFLALGFAAAGGANAPAAALPAAADFSRRGLQLWLKADGEIRRDGDTIVQWNDLSGQGNHAVRGAATNVPATNPALVTNVANGKPALRFDGSDVWFSFKRMADMRTIFWVVSKDPAAFGQRNERFVFGDDNFCLLYNTDFHPGTHTKSFLLHNNTCSAFLREGQVRLNGRLVDGQTTDFPKTLGVISMVSAGNVTTSHLSYDRGYTGRSWQGDIAEVLVYNRVLSDAERAKVERYLFDKYGIGGQTEHAPPSEAWTAAAALGHTPVKTAAAPRPIIVAALAFTPDGKAITTASDRVRLWNAATGKLIRALEGAPGPEAHPPVPGEPGQFTRLGFSPDGKLLAACGTDLAMRFWNYPDCAPVPVKGDLAKPGAALWGFAFSLDGRTLISNNRERGNDVRRYDLPTGTVIPYLDKPTNDWQGRLWWIAYSPDGKRIASSSENKTIRVWDAATGALVNTLDTGSIVWSFAFSPDSKTLAAACVNMTLQLWDMDSGTLRQTLSGHGAGLTSVVYSPDGTMIATGSDDATIRLWDARTGRALRTLNGHVGCVWSLAFSPDGRTLASGGQDDTMKLWEPRSGRLVRSFEVVGRRPGL